MRIKGIENLSEKELKKKMDYLMTTDNKRRHPHIFGYLLFHFKRVKNAI